MSASTPVISSKTSTINPGAPTTPDAKVDNPLLNASILSPHWLPDSACLFNNSSNLGSLKTSTSRVPSCNLSTNSDLYKLSFKYALFTSLPSTMYFGFSTSPVKPKEPSSDTKSISLAAAESSTATCFPRPSTFVSTP